MLWPAWALEDAMIKTLRAAVLPAALVVTVSACGGGGSGPTATLPPTQTPTPTPTATQPDLGTWTPLTSMNDPARQEHGVALLDGRIYVAGGHPGDESTLKTAEVYDIATDRWSRLPDLPIGLSHCAMVAARGKLYLFGGQSPEVEAPGVSDRTYEFDPATQAWRERAPMPTARSAAAAGLIGDKIYVVGGSPPAASARLEAYSPSTDTWEALPSMPTRRNHLTAVATAGLLYVAGGRDVTSDSFALLERFDPATNAWTTLAPMPTARNSHMAAAVKGYLYVMGGQTNPSDSSGVFAQNEVYSPQTDSWQTVAAMLTPRHATGAIVQGDKIYVPGGAIHSGYGATKVHEVYAPPATKSCQ
jgi:N-acetylneuraminic acid mutarotase